MTASRIALVVALALAAQTTLTRLVGVAIDVDFLLIVVVFVALSRGPIVGLWAGTVGGLAQDLLSGGIVGVSGLAKSLVGFTVGWLGVHFLTSRAWHRVLILFVSTLVHAAWFVGVYTLIAPGAPPAAWTCVLTQAGANALVGIVAAATCEHGPGMWKRAQIRRGGFATRRWRVN